MAKASKGEKRLKELEKEIKSRGVYLGYERLRFAGLVLKSGMCWFKGRYYLFVDLRKKLRERIELLETALDELNGLAASGRLDRPFDPDGPAQDEAPEAEAGAAPDAGDQAPDDASPQAEPEASSPAEDDAAADEAADQAAEPPRETESTEQAPGADTTQTEQVGGEAPRNQAPPAGEAA